MRSKDVADRDRLVVDVPSPGKDSPGWVKIGVIAAVGFVIGIAWPRLAGVKLGPTAPGEAAAAAAASASAKAGRAADAKPADTKADAPPASVKAKSEPSASASVAASAAGGGPPQISVLRGNVVSCKTDDGEAKKGKECGGVAALDQVVSARLKKLSTCAAAEGQTGKLSFMVQADFKGGHMTWDIGKSSTVGNHDGISGCLKTIFQGVTLGGVAHEHPRYTVAYNATFSPSEKDKGDAKDDKSATKAKDEPKKDDAKKDDAKKDDDAKDDKPLAAGGEAAVAWEVALVRDTPKTGAVVARLPRGTKVKIGTSKDGWYAVKYGDGFASDGWVYRGAIGR